MDALSGESFARPITSRGLPLRPPIGAIVVAAMSLAAPSSVVRGQASFLESFDDIAWNNPGEYGPAALVQRGWIFRNQSSPLGGQFEEGPALAMPSQDGDKYLGAKYAVSNTPGTPPGVANLWAILPTIPNQQGGDPIRVWLRAGWNTSTLPARIEVRYSPGGGVGTGSGPSDVGDFTEVLIEADPVPRDTWVEFAATVPGNGRLAIRFTAPAERFRPSDYVGIDTLTIGAVGPPPCVLPPLPAAGETVTWTAAGSPYTVGCDATIPSGGTVIVEGGVVVQFGAGVAFNVAGMLAAQGVPGNPVAFVATDPSSPDPPQIEVATDGVLDLQRATIAVDIVPRRRASVICADCEFTASIEQIQFLEEVYYVELRRCQFTNGAIRLANGTVVLRDVTFNSPQFGASVFGCYAFFENVSVTGSTAAGLYLLAHPEQQPVYLSNLSVTNSNGPGLKLWGGNFHVGPSNVLRGNTYAVSGDPGFGLMPGSLIPAIGNANDHVQAGEASGFVDLRIYDAVWAPVGVPYVLRGNVFMFSSTWTILPGVTVRMWPYSSINPDAGYLVARGLPDAPITFERFNPSQPWDALHYARTQRIEYCVIDGSRYGAFAGVGAGDLYIDNCTFRNNDRASAFSSTVRGSRYHDNVIAAYSGELNGLTNPNEFVGNALAVNVAADATHNWWGDPSGPTTPDNPGGTGDPLNAGVPFLPFRTVAPDFNDHPPVVKLNQPSFLFEPGARVLITWEVWDDQAVVSQRIEFGNPNTGTSTIISGLPPGQRAHEWTVPDIGYTPSGGSPTIRVVCIDIAGHEGWDRAEILIPDDPPTGTVTVTSDVGGQTFTCGDVVVLTATGDVSYGWLLLDGEGRKIPLGAITDVEMPFISTDSARLAVARLGSINDQEWAFSEPFAIRPDARIGDAPPSVTLLSPSEGASFPGGTVVPVNWSATDDEAISRIAVQASYDFGRTWHFLESNLPGDVTQYQWHLPASDGNNAVRLRVVVHDRRFQNSSDVVGIAITPGAPSLPGDIDGDGDVDLTDQELFIGVLIGTNTIPEQVARSDVNEDGLADGADVKPFAVARLGY